VVNEIYCAKHPAPPGTERLAALLEKSRFRPRGRQIGREQPASADLQARELIKRRKAKARPQVSRVCHGKQVFRGAAVAQQFKDIPQTPLMSAR
jgi:hypothetical protein